MIEIMVQGRVKGKFTERVTKNDKPYVTGHIIAFDQKKERQLISAICFDIDILPILLNLEDYDEICVIGHGSPNKYIDSKDELQVGLDLLVIQVMTIYQVNKKKKKIQEEEVYTPKIPTKEQLDEFPDDDLSSDIL